MSFSPFAILTAEEMNDLVENIESLADGTGFDAGAVSGDKLADANTQHLSYNGTAVDMVSASYVDLSTNTATASVPTWATSAIVTTTINRTQVVSAATEYQLKVVIGTDSGNAITQIHPTVANESYVETWVGEVTLTSTGSKTMKVQGLRVSGTGALRIATSTRFNFKVEYKA